MPLIRLTRVGMNERKDVPLWINSAHIVAFHTTTKDRNQVNGLTIPGFTVTEITATGGLWWVLETPEAIIQELIEASLT